MGQIYDKMPFLIKEAMKSKEKIVIEEGKIEVKQIDALRNFKSKLDLYKTSEDGAPIVNANNGRIPDEKEIEVLTKYIKMLTKTADNYTQLKSPNMAKACQVEIAYLSPFMPQKATEEDIENCFKQWWDEQYPEIDVRDYQIEKNQMSGVMKYIRENLNNVDGKMASVIVRGHIA